MQRRLLAWSAGSFFCFIPFQALIRSNWDTVSEKTVAVEFFNHIFLML